MEIGLPLKCNDWHMYTAKCGKVWNDFLYVHVEHMIMNTLNIVSARDRSCLKDLQFSLIVNKSE